MAGEAGARNQETKVRKGRAGLAYRLRRTSLATPARDNREREANPRPRENARASWRVMSSREIYATLRVLRVGAICSVEAWRKSRI
eukprot:3098166-Pyramimonas_sp.AAC.1